MVTGEEKAEDCDALCGHNSRCCRKSQKTQDTR